jgi:hypothetical protein
VIVLAPRLGEDDVSPAAAAATDLQSTPPWEKNLRSSAATTAAIQAAEISSMGVHARRRAAGSERDSCRSRPLRSRSADSEPLDLSLTWRYEGTFGETRINDAPASAIAAARRTPAFEVIRQRNIIDR